MEKQQPITAQEIVNKLAAWSKKYPDGPLYLPNTPVMIEWQEIEKMAREFKTQPLPPTPELQQMLDKKFPIEGHPQDPYNIVQSVYRGIATDFYNMGQSSLKQGTEEKEENFYCKEWNNVGYVCEEQCPSCKKTNDFEIPVKQGTPTDEEIEKAASDYVKEYCDLGNEKEVNGAIYDFTKGMKHYRDTYASKQEIDVSKLLDLMYQSLQWDSGEITGWDRKGLESALNQLFKSQLSEEKKDV